MTDKYVKCVFCGKMFDSEKLHWELTGGGFTVYAHIECIDDRVGGKLKDLALSYMKKVSLRNF